MKITDTAIGAFEAKNTFSELLERVGRGAEFTITKHNRPIARLVAASEPSHDQRKKGTAELRQLRQRYSLKGLSVRALIEDGRR